MKTIDIVTMPKGFYVTKRYSGQAQRREYFKTKTAMNTYVKALKAEGYVISK